MVRRLRGARWQREQHRLQRARHDNDFDRRYFRSLLVRLSRSQLLSHIQYVESQICPHVYAFDPVANSAYHPMPGDIPWLILWLCASFHKQHSFTNSMRHSPALLRADLEKFFNELRWQQKLRKVDSSPPLFGPAQRLLRASAYIRVQRPGASDQFLFFASLGFVEWLSCPGF